MKLTVMNQLRSAMRLGICVVIVWLAGMAAAPAQAVSTTTVQGTVYLANGQPAGGTLEVSWPAFTTAAGQLIAAGKTTMTMGADGFVSVNLAPNLGSIPAGEYYTAVFYMSDGTTSTEYWVVPAAAQASLAQVQAQVMPAAEAVQAVSKAYVDQAVSQALSSQIATSGGNLTGPLYLSGDPTQPLQAADKHYVDSTFSAALPLSGGETTGPITATGLGVVHGSGEVSAASINSMGDAQFDGALQVGGTSTFNGSMTVTNQADAEVDSILQAGLTAPQKESLTYRDFSGANEWYMAKDQNNDWALNSATGNLDSFKAYQNTNSGDTYINAAKPSGVVRVNYETGAGTAFNIYGGDSSHLYASFGAANAIKFPGLAASGGSNCLQIDNSGYISNTGFPCASGLGGTVGTGSSGQIAYYTENGTTIAGMNTIPVSAGGTGASTAAGALATLLPGVTADGNNGASVQNNLGAATVSAGAVNGVWDLKTKFGAIGSNKTMTCTATASSNTLTGCTGGDFTAGEYVFIPFLGAAPTVASPSAPTAVCGEDNGGSCTGTTQYCYKIAAVQSSYVSAPLSVPSASTCVTQAAHTAQSAFQSSVADIYTTVSWTCPSGSKGCAIYKSINGGAYNFYEYYPGSGAQSTKDFGHAPSAQFSVAELGFPAMAPSVAIPSGIFAQIASVSGSTVTLQAHSIPNKLDPSQPGASGTATINHDDTPAFAAAWAAIRANSGNGTIQVHIPAGNYMVYGYNQPSGTGTQPGTITIDGLSNVVWNGDGEGVTNIFEDYTQGQGNFLFGQCGWYNTVACTQYTWGGQGRGYTLADPELVGSSNITLATPSDSSNFSVGGYITVFDNASSYPYEMYSELNKVTAIDAATGVLTLAYPLSKTYSASLPSPYSTCASCSATPMAYPVVGGATASNIAFQNFSFRGPVVFANVNTVDGLTFRNTQIVAQAFMLNGQMRNQTEIGNTITEDPWSPQSTWGMIDNAAGSADTTATGNSYSNLRAGGSYTEQFCSEGSANVYDSDNSYLLSGSTDTPSPVINVFSPASMAWNCNMEGDKVVFANTNFNGVFGGDGGNGGEGIIKNTKFYIDSVGLNKRSSVGKAWAFGRSFTSPYVIMANDNVWTSPDAANLGITSVNDHHYKPTFDSVTYTGVSGNYTGVSSAYGVASLYILDLAGNGTYLNQLSLGSTRIANYRFTIALVQPSSGGNSWFYQGPTCAASFWGVNLDCTNQQPPTIPGVNGSVTIMNFWDDGTTVHLLGFNAAATAWMSSYSSSIIGNYNNNIWGNASSYTFTMTGNVNQVLMEGGDHKGMLASVSFVQPASGGPYSLPSSCSSSWGLGNGAVDFGAAYAQ